MLIIQSADDWAQNISLVQYLPNFYNFQQIFFMIKVLGHFSSFYADIKISFLYNQCHLLSFQHYTLPVFQVVFYGQYYRPQRPNNRVLLQLDCLDKILNYSLKIILHTQYTLLNRRFLQVGQGQIICLQYSRQFYNELYQRPWINIFIDI